MKFIRHKNGDVSIRITRKEKIIGSEEMREAVVLMSYQFGGPFSTMGTLIDSSEFTSLVSLGTESLIKFFKLAKQQEHVPFVEGCRVFGETEVVTKEVEKL